MRPRPTAVTTLMTSAALVGLATLAGCGGGGAAKVTVTPTPAKAASAASLATTVSSSLVAYWSCDKLDGTTLPDDSGNGNDGVVSKCSLAGGVAGNALVTGWIGSVKIDDDKDLRLTGQATFSMWIRVDDDTVNEYQRLISKKDTWDGREGYEVGYNPGTDELDVIGGGSDFARVYVNLVPGWHHIAATVSGSKVRIWADGGELIGDNDISPLKQGNQPLYIGMIQPDYAHWNGALDEIRIYDRTLSDSEIMALADKKPKGLVGHWAFDEGSGTVAADISGHNHDGTVAGATWLPGAKGGALNFVAPWPTEHAPGVVTVNTSETELALTGQFSIAAWIQVADPEQDQYMRIASKKIAWNDPWGFEFEYNPGLNYLDLPGGNGVYGRAENVDLDAGWHHVCVSVNGNQATYYVDGSVVPNAGPIGAIQTGTHPLLLGNTSQPWAGWNGSLDDIRIYDYAISASDAAALAKPTAMVDKLGPFSWARVLYNPKSPVSSALPRELDSTEAGSLRNGDEVKGTIDLTAWSGDSQSSGVRGWGGNTLVGPTGRNYWVGLTAWDILEGSDTSGSWVWTRRQAQDAKLLIGYVDVSGGAPAVSHGSGLELGANLGRDQVVLTMPYRFNVTGNPNSSTSATWQTGTYITGGIANPVEFGLWQVPAGQSLAQAQVDRSANLLADLDEFSKEWGPRVKPGWRLKLQLKASGSWMVEVDEDGDGDTEKTWQSGKDGGKPFTVKVDESSGLFMSSMSAAGARTGRVIRSTATVVFDESPSWLSTVSYALPGGRPDGLR